MDAIISKIKRVLSETEEVPASELIRLILIGLFGCVVLSVYLKVPYIVSIPLLLVPLSVAIWLYYRPFPESQLNGEPQTEKNSDAGLRNKG